MFGLSKCKILFISHQFLGIGRFSKVVFIGDNLCVQGFCIKANNCVSEKSYNIFRMFILWNYVVIMKTVKSASKRRMFSAWLDVMQLEPNALTNPNSIYKGATMDIWGVKGISVDDWVSFCLYLLATHRRFCLSAVSYNSWRSW